MDIVNKITVENFNIPLIQEAEDNYFPDFLKKELDKYIKSYESILFPIIDQSAYFISKGYDNVISTIISFSNILNETIELYYKGRFLEATSTFNKGMDEVLLYETSISAFRSISKDEINFYRARKNQNIHFTKSDLFHIKFEERHLVSTNRFSAPGFPSLYLGGSTYVCWEEFDKHKLHDLWFSMFTNMRDLDIIQIQRIEDFLFELVNYPSKKAVINNDPNEVPFAYLRKYFLTFPLTIACSIKVKHPQANFKPEYIIPQLLLQYVTINKDIDGIKYPSTQVVYSILKNIDAYNYVFPVKQISKSGFCSSLADTFYLTEPTSLELEEIGFNPSQAVYLQENMDFKSFKEIELIKGVKLGYENTPFGKLESILESREIGRVDAPNCISMSFS